MKSISTGYNLFFLFFIRTITLCYFVATSNSLIWAEELPDHLDHTKHERIYQGAKEISDQERAMAKEIQDQWNLFTEEKIRFKDSINQKEQTITLHFEKIDELNLQIPNLDKEIESLSYEIKQWERRRNENQREEKFISTEIQDLEKEENEIQSKLDRITTDLNSQKENVHQLLQEQGRRTDEVSRGQQRTRELRRSIESKKSQRMSNNDRINNIKFTHIPSLRRKIRSSKNTVKSYKSEERQVKNQIDSTRSRVNELNRDVEVAERRVSEEKRKLGPFERALREAKQKVITARDDMNRVQSRYSSLTSQLDRLKSRRQQRKNKIQTLVQSNKNLRKTISDLQSRQKKISARIVQLTQNIKNKTQKIKQIKSRPQMSEDDKIRLQKLRSERKNLKQKKANRENKLKEVKSQLVGSNQKLEAQKKKVQSLRVKQKQIKALISSKTSEVNKAKGNLDRKTSLLSQARENKNQAKGDFDRQSVAWKEATAQKAVLQRNLSEAKQKVISLSGKHDNLVKRRKKEERQVTSFQRKLSKLNNKVNYLTGVNNELSHSIYESERQLNQAEETLRYAERELNDVDLRLSNATQEKEKTQGEWNVVNGRLSQNLDQQSRLEKKRGDLISENLRIENQVWSNNNQIVENRETIALNKSDIHQLKNREIPLLQEAIRSLKDEVQVLTRRIADTKSRFEAQDKRARDLENITSEKLAIYEKVKLAFDEIFNRSVVGGYNQGQEAGELSGSQQGTSDGLQEGTQEGAIVGKKEGLLFGYNLGQKMGREDGDNNGYKAGFQDPESRRVGLDKGLAQGLKDAQAEAKLRDYPKGRKEQRTEMMSQLPEQEVTLDNMINGNSGDFGLARDGATLAIASPQLHFLELSSILTSETRQTEGDSQDTQCIISSLYIEKPHVPEIYNCDFEYSVFNNACKKSFSETYINSYITLYRDRYSAEFYSSCEIERKRVFEAHKSIRFKEGYDETYHTAFTESEVIGAKEAQRENFLLGKKRGFDDNISEQRQIFYQRGRDDESNYFSENAVVKLLSASWRAVQPRSSGIVIAGDKLIAEVKVANFGSMDTTGGDLKVRAEALTSGLLISPSWTNLVSVPGNSVAHIINVLPLAVDTKMAKSHTAQIKIILMNNNGEESETILDIPITAISVDLWVKKSRSQLRPPILEPARVSLRVKNQNETNIVDNLKLSWSLPEKASKWIKFSTPNPIEIKASPEDPIKPNEYRSTQLRYQVIDFSAVHKKIPLSLKVSIGEYVIEEHEVIITPQRRESGGR